MATIIAATADKHCGSSLGLCPRYFQRVDGDAYRANKGQNWAFRKWNEYWDDVREIRDALQKNGEEVRVWGLNVGDDADKDKRGIERVTNNPADLVRLTAEVHKPMVETCDRYWFIRGTLSHQGEQGWLAEMVGTDLGAVQDENGAYSQWHLCATTEGVNFDAYHRPQTRGLLPWTEPSAPSRASSIIRMRCADAGYDPPDLVFFGHVHHFVASGVGRKPLVVFLPSWQLPYDWVHNVGLGMTPPPIGGVIVILRDGEIEIIPKLYRPLRSKRWTESSQT